jgi:hypothetical protein
MFLSRNLRRARPGSVPGADRPAETLRRPAARPGPADDRRWPKVPHQVLRAARVRGGRCVLEALDVQGVLPLDISGQVERRGPIHGEPQINHGCGAQLTKTLARSTDNKRPATRPAASGVPGHDRAPPRARLRDRRLEPALARGVRALQGGDERDRRAGHLRGAAAGERRGVSILEAVHFD